MWCHTVRARHATQQNVVGESKNMKHVNYVRLNCTEKLKKNISSTRLAVAIDGFRLVNVCSPAHVLYSRIIDRMHSGMYFRVKLTSSSNSAASKYNISGRSGNRRSSYQWFYSARFCALFYQLLFTKNSRNFRLGAACAVLHAGSFHPCRGVERE